MAYQFTKTCEILVADTPKIMKTLPKYNFPANNHILAYDYAKALDLLIDFSDLKKEAKPMSLLYHKILCHTFKHILHNHKRFTRLPHIYKVWAIVDFQTGEGSYFSYSEYPKIYDLVALKKEISLRTYAKIDVYDTDIDKSLENINIGAMCDLVNYTTKGFKDDFDVAQPFWLSLIDFIQADKGKLKIEALNKIKKK